MKKEASKVNEDWKKRFKEWRKLNFSSQISASLSLEVSQNEISRIELLTDPEKNRDNAKGIKPSTLEKLVHKGLNLNWLFAGVGKPLINENINIVMEDAEKYSKEEALTLKKIYEEIIEMKQRIQALEAEKKTN